MPNYQLPEIPGGVVWVRVSEILQENLDAIKLAKDRGYDEDEIFEGQHTRYDAVIETYEDLLAILKPIPVTPVKEVEAEEIKNMAAEWAEKFQTGEWFERLRMEAYIAGFNAASLKEKGGSVSEPLPNNTGEENNSLINKK